MQKRKVPYGETLLHSLQMSRFKQELSNTASYVARVLHAERRRHTGDGLAQTRSSSEYYLAEFIDFSCAYVSLDSTIVIRENRVLIRTN